MAASTAPRSRRPRPPTPQADPPTRPPPEQRCAGPARRREHVLRVDALATGARPRTRPGRSPGASGDSDRRAQAPIRSRGPKTGRPWFGDHPRGPATTYQKRLTGAPRASVQAPREQVDAGDGAVARGMTRRTGHDHHRTAHTDPEVRPDAPGRPPATRTYVVDCVRSSSHCTFTDRGLVHVRATACRVSAKSRTVAALLAFLLGVIGVLRLYVGKTGDRDRTDPDARRTRVLDARRLHHDPGGVVQGQGRCPSHICRVTTPPARSSRPPAPLAPPSPPRSRSTRRSV